ncbi:MAG: MFS transporter [Alphaproteobacteria bacterium]|nr:MFS transporter [Alphaproteobacteria bacterium]
MSTATQAAAPAAAVPRPVSAYSWIVVAMLCFIYIFNFLDRQLMSTLQEFIKKDLNLTDEQLGLMTGLYFALFYTGFGVIVGFLADRTSRVRILFFGCFLWSLFTSLCGISKTYPVMVTARIGVGVGEAAGAPPSYSIISDYFPAEKRGLALAVFSLGVPFGQALGAGFGAKIAELYSWRMAFIGIGIIGIIASFILLLVVKEPKRGAADAPLDTHMEEAPVEALERPGFIRTFIEFFTRPVLVLTALGCGLTALVGYAALGWNVSFLTRVKHMAIGDIALYYAMMIAVAMGLGTWLSGLIVDWLVKRSKIWYAMLPAIAVGLSIPFYVGYVYAPTWQVALACLAGPTFLTIMYLAPALAVVQNSVKPAQRTQAGAMLLMVLNLIGLGGGPSLVGTLSTWFHESKGMSDAAGLQAAMFWVTPFYAITVVVLLLEAWAIAKEVRSGRMA